MLLLPAGAVLFGGSGAVLEAPALVAGLDDVDPANESDWARQHQWLAKRLNDFHRVFAQRVKDLDEDDWRPDEDEAGTADG